MDTRDIVVMGASVGGVEALSRVIAGLPEDFPGTVFVVLHMPADATSHLPNILQRAGKLPAEAAEDDAPIRPGRIYVAPPDHHLLVKHGRMCVVRGPRENRHRPAVDPLFRTAAQAYGPRVVGVVLTGSLDDGTAGMIAVKVRGGIAVVQDPAEAFSSSMPRSVMRYLEVDHVLPLARIGPLLADLAGQPVSLDEAPPPSEEMVHESRAAELDLDTMGTEEQAGTLAPVTCPDCHGNLWEIQEGDHVRYRCRVGHALSTESMLAAHDDSVEQALWEALRSLEERIALRKRLIEQAHGRRLTNLAVRFEDQLETIEKHAGSLRKVLLNNPRKESRGA
ncbi:MAG: chemotaxis protein CheB [Thermoanaerobaculia bacterium]